MKPILVVAVVLVVLSVLFSVLWFTGVIPRSGQPDTQGVDKVVNKPISKYPSAPEESVRAQTLSQVDFSNPHTIKNVPRMIPTMKAVEKLVVIRKLKDVGTLEAVTALQWIVENDKAAGEDRVLGQAAGALVAMDSEESWKSLERLATSENPVIREAVAISLGYSKNDFAGEILKGLETDSAGEVRAAAKSSSEKRTSLSTGK